MSHCQLLTAESCRAEWALGKRSRYKLRVPVWGLAYTSVDPLSVRLRKGEESEGSASPCYLSAFCLIVLDIGDSVSFLTVRLLSLINVS